MSKIEQVLKGLRSESDLREYVKECSILMDELSLELIKRIGGPHSPFSIYDLPIPNFPRDLALVRLYKLEDLHVFTSKFVKKGQGYVRVFEATPVARRLAKIISKK